MIDQDAVTRRVVERLEPNSKKLLDLSAEELDTRIAKAFGELLGETLVYPVAQENP